MLIADIVEPCDNTEYWQEDFVESKIHGMQQYWECLSYWDGLSWWFG